MLYNLLIGYADFPIAAARRMGYNQISGNDEPPRYQEKYSDGSIVW